MLERLTPATDVDQITVEVIRRRLVAIADQVDANIMRTAFSPYVYEYKDYAVGIVDAAGAMLCQSSGGLPIFLADIMGAAVREGLAIYGHDDVNRGDIFITNAPETIGQHLNNVVMYSPVTTPDGDVLAYMVVVMHWIDIGGITIGSVSNACTDVFQEGLQLKSLRLHAGGRPSPELYRVIECNSRLHVEVMGDIAAQVAGCKLGCSELEHLIGDYGADVFESAKLRMWDQSEAAVREAVRAVPDGTYTAEAFLDDDGLERGERIPLKVSVIVRGDEITIDLSGLPKESRASINAGPSGGGQSVARLGLRYALMPNEVANEGTFRPLKLVLPEGTIMSPSRKAARGHYNTALPTLVDLVIRALGQASPERAVGAHYGTFGSIRFVGERLGGKGAFQCNDSAFGGWGALHDQDGSGPYRTMCHGDTRVISVEVQEASYPFLFESVALRPDSGGAGEFRGGLGMTKWYQVLAPCTIITNIDRTSCPAWGANGGRDGLPTSATVHFVDGRQQLILKEEVKLQPGDRIYVETGGGGGWGSPSKRREELLRRDLEFGYVTADGLKRDYQSAQ
jgi:N-methylhydantoinase B